MNVKLKKFDCAQLYAPNVGAVNLNWSEALRAMEAPVSSNAKTVS